jgi:hypothetical protein
MHTRSQSSERKEDRSEKEDGIAQAKEVRDMTDLETILLHCEREPSIEALSYAADEFLAAGDEIMYRGLVYMANNMKMPWKLTDQYYSLNYAWVPGHYEGNSSIGKPYFRDNLDHTNGSLCNYPVIFGKFADAVRWIGKRLREMDAEKVFRAEQSIPDDAGIMS